MIERIIWFVFTILNMLFEGFVFMFGWNSFIHKVGFPTISYPLALCLCLFISYMTHKDSEIDDEDRNEYIKNKTVSNFVHNLVYVVCFVIFNWLLFR